MTIFIVVNKGNYQIENIFDYFDRKEEAASFVETEKKKIKLEIAS